MVTSTTQTKPARAGLVDRILAFFILFFGWIALDRIFEQFNFLAIGDPLWHALGSGTSWVALMVIFAPAFSSVGMQVRRAFRSRQHQSYLLHGELEAPEAGTTRWIFRLTTIKN